MNGKSEEDYLQTISSLQKENSTLRQNAHQAAIFGKELFEENEKFSTKFENLVRRNEELEQESYSLRLNLETKITELQNQALELNTQKEQVDNLNQKISLVENENLSLYMKFKNLLKENEDLKKWHEELQLENNAYKKRINLQEEQIKAFQYQAEQSICEVNDEELQTLQSDLNIFMKKNKELEDNVSQLSYELKQANMKEEHLTKDINELKSIILEKDKEISTYSSEIENYKDEIAELKTDIEVYKYEQTDINRKGNSVFAEVEDRRLLVEKEYKMLQKKYQTLQNNSEEMHKELRKVKGQMLYLLNLTTRKSDLAYIEELETALLVKKNELNELTNKMIKEAKKTKEIESKQQAILNKQHDEYDYLRIMLQQAQEKIQSLETEVFNLRKQNIVDNDKLTETLYILHQNKSKCDKAEAELMKLKLKLEEFIPSTEDIENEEEKEYSEILPNIKQIVNENKNISHSSNKADNSKRATMSPKIIDFDESKLIQGNENCLLKSSNNYPNKVLSVKNSNCAQQ